MSATRFSATPTRQIVSDPFQLRREVPTARQRLPFINPATGRSQRPTTPSHPEINQKIKDTFQWKHEARQFQLEAISAQLKGEDAIVHAATGSGKTTIVAGPHALPTNKGKVTIFVSPLIALQEEMVNTFRTEFGLSAIAVNSSREGSLEQLMKVYFPLHLSSIISSPWPRKLLAGNSPSS